MTTIKKENHEKGTEIILKKTEQENKEEKFNNWNKKFTDGLNRFELAWEISKLEVRATDIQCEELKAEKKDGKKWTDPSLIYVIGVP